MLTTTSGYCRHKISERSVSGAENGVERAENRLERSGALSGVQKIKWSVSGKSSERERSGERAKSAAQNSLHRKTTNSYNLNRFLKLL